MLAYILAVIVLLVAALLAFGLAALLHLGGGMYLGFVIAVFLLGIAATITIIVMHRRAKKEREQQGAEAGSAATAELDLMLNDANRKLRTSQQGAKALDALPLLYILGESGSAKTTTVLKSGLDPELLAGSASQDGEQVPTAVINLWFTKAAALLEVGASVRSNATLLGRLVHRTRAKAYRSAFGSGAAPRAVVVCLSADQLLVQDAGQSLMTSARATGTQLREISRILGMPVPVYVIITKLDRVPHFAEYVRNLSDAEVRQVLGVPLPRSEASAGVYAEQASRALAGVIDRLVYQLGEFRVEMLDRETDPKNVGGVYEFPREFGKFRKNLNQYLVELCKPSQLSANPYLRGFYFSGIRARIVERAVNTPAAVEPRPVFQDAGATQFINLSMARTAPRSAAAAPVMTQARVPQWTFLARVLPEVILGDRSALTATRQSAPAKLFRRILYGTIAFLFAVYIVCLTVSYFNNAAVERRIQDAAHALPASDATAISMAGEGELRALDGLRQTIVQLQGWRNQGAPFSYRVGLYQGEKLEDEARQVYFDRFRPMLLNPAQAGFAGYMRNLPTVPQDISNLDSYLSAYNSLKAYLITTNHPEKSDPKFLTPVFLSAWNGSRPPLDDKQKNLVSQQIDFYANELLRQPPYSITPDAGVVDHTQDYLSKFLAETRIYQNMLLDADKAGSPIDFNRTYPDAVKWVRDDKTVRGAFSRNGFDAMQGALKNPGKYAQGERWVLGDKSSQLPDLQTLSNTLSGKYQSDYLAAWTGFLQSARVSHCNSLQEASAELDALSGPTSPILELMYTISHNTAVPNDAISKVFQPAQVVVDPNAKDRLTNQTNQQYLQALAALKGAVDQALPAPPKDAAAFQPISTAVTTAKGAVTPITLNFNVDPDRSRHTETSIKDRLLEPIKCVEDQAPKAGDAENKSGGAICQAITHLAGKFPFATNASAPPAALAEVDKVFAPETGELWTNFAGLKGALVPSGQQYVAAPSAPGPVNPKFPPFFSRAAHISTVMYPNGAKSASFTFNLRFIPGNGVSSATFVMDGQKIASGNTQSFNWSGVAAQSASLLVDGVSTQPYTGTWSVFQLVRDAQITRTAGGYRLDYKVNSAITVQNRATTGTGGGTKLATFELSGPGADLLVGDGFIGLNCAYPVILGK